MRGVAITLGAAVLATAGWWLTSAALVFLEIAILDPLLSVGAAFVVLGLAENALARWMPPQA